MCPRNAAGMLPGIGIVSPEYCCKKPGAELRLGHARGGDRSRACRKGYHVPGNRYCVPGIRLAGNRYCVPGIPPGIAVGHRARAAVVDRRRGQLLVLPRFPIRRATSSTRALSLVIVIPIYVSDSMRTVCPSRSTRKVCKSWEPAITRSELTCCAPISLRTLTMSSNSASSSSSPTLIDFSILPSRFKIFPTWNFRGHPGTSGDTIPDLGDTTDSRGHNT